MYSVLLDCAGSQLPLSPLPFEATAAPEGMTVQQNTPKSTVFILKDLKISQAWLGIIKI